MGRLADGIFDSYQASGVREDLADFISMISPEETPFVSSIGNTKAGQRLHQWQTDSLAAATGNSVTEAEQWAATYMASTNVMNNRVQHFTKMFAVTDTSDVVTTAGRS